MEATILTFPSGRIARSFPEHLPADATPYEEALFRVRRARARRDTTARFQREHHVAGFILEWWEGELARLSREAV